MDKERAIDLLKQALTEIPNLREKHYDSQDFELWISKIKDIIKNGLDEGDYMTFVEGPPRTKLSKNLPFERLNEHYQREITLSETALKSIIQKYEILWIEEGYKEGEVGKMDKARVMAFLNEKMQEIYHLEVSSPDNKDFPIWCKTIEGVLLKHFGKDSFEYKTFIEAAILRGIVEDRYNQYRKALRSREEALVSIIKTQETIGDEGNLELKDIVKSPINLFDAMKIHPKVIEASRSLFKDKYYSDAIFRAFTAVINFVKEKSGSSLEGKTLMSTVFNEEKPIIKINELLDKYDRDEQEGFKFLFMGGQVGIRNPKAHYNVVQNDPYKTLEYLSLASLLMKTIEEGKVVKL